MSASESETTPLLQASQTGGLVDNTSGKPAIVDVIENSPSSLESGDQVTDHRDNNDDAIGYGQIILLCWTSLADPVAYFTIFPFINEMIHKVGEVPVSNVGYWAGTIESLFSFTQMLLLVFYGRMADTIGRRPVLIFSLIGISCSVALFGFSSSLLHMVLYRCIGGLFAGSAVTVRTMVAENCTPKTQSRAFSWLMFASNAGILVGPIIGGGLSNPTEVFPGIFGNSQLLRDYPYALSSVVAGLFISTSWILCIFFLKETLIVKKDDTAPRMTTWQVLSYPGVPFVLYFAAHLGVVALGYTAVSATFQYTEIDLGGFGFTNQQIALFLAIAGCSQAMWMLLAFAPLQQRFGTGNVARGAVLVYTVCLGAFPALNELRRHGYDTAFWVGMYIGIPLFSGCALSFACMQLFINDISPSKRVLATMNALGLTVNSLTRALVPAIFGSIYASGVRSQWADGHLVWVVLAVICGLLNVSLFYLPEAAEGRPGAKKAVAEDAVGREESNVDGQQ